MDYTISVAAPADYKEIYRLQLCAYQTEDELYDYTIPPMLQTLEEASADCAACTVLKAVAGGVIIGSVRAREQGGAAHIGKLMVLPAYRGRGIGTALLHEMERVLPAQKYALFTGTRSERNIALYQRCGYHITGSDEEKELVFMERARH